MSKYHNGPNGPGVCRAKKGNCPFGGADSHFDTIDEAQEVFNQKQAEEFGIMPGVEVDKGLELERKREEYFRSEPTGVYASDTFLTYEMQSYFNSLYNHSHETNVTEGFEKRAKEHFLEHPEELEDREKVKKFISDTIREEVVEDIKRQHPITADGWEVEILSPELKERKHELEDRIDEARVKGSNEVFHASQMVRQKEHELINTERRSRKIQERYDNAERDFQESNTLVNRIFRPSMRREKLEYMEYQAESLKDNKERINEINKELNILRDEHEEKANSPERKEYLKLIKEKEEFPKGEIYSLEDYTKKVMDERIQGNSEKEADILINYFKNAPGN